MYVCLVHDGVRATYTVQCEACEEFSAVTSRQLHADIHQPTPFKYF